MEIPIKKRRLVNGEELMFRRPGEGIDDDSAEEILSQQIAEIPQLPDLSVVASPVFEPARITIVEEE